MLLIGNSFPLSLIRRKVMIEPARLERLREEIGDAGGVLSFWGHANTLPAAEEAVGRSLAPATERPALELSSDRYPVFQNKTFTECWILSPDYTGNFRPNIGEEVPTEKIRGWQVLRMEREANQETSLQ